MQFRQGPYESSIRRYEDIHYVEFNVYDSFIELTALKSEIYRQLYSIAGWEKNDADVIATVSSLDSLLQEWTDTIPEEYSPGTISADELVRVDVHLNMVYLHLSYYNCLLTIHRRAITRATWSMHVDPCRGQSKSFRPTNTRPFISIELCATAARASMELVLCIPKSHPVCPGLV